MANRIRTIDFLPEIFRTETNKQFLGSTLDQLVQEPKLKATQGYIGRRVGPGVNPNDNYVIEPSDERSNYQLEPGLVFLENNTNNITDVLTYPGYIDRLRLKGANVEKHDRLFSSEFYSWDPFVDFDKFVNFGQYYWLPAGPDSVDVSSTDIPLTDDFTVTRGAEGYTFSDQVGTLPTITLVREGSYTFELNQTGNPFWIQSVPGADGTLSQNSQSSREVLGVINNGDDNGTITFNVPDKSAQNFFFELTDAGKVDLVTNLQFNQINNIYVNEFLSTHGGIDGINDLEGRTIIFTNTIPGEDGGWLSTTQFDSETAGYDETTFDQTTILTLDSQKYSVWQIQYVYDDSDNPFIRLVSNRSVANLSKLFVNYGTQYAGTQFWKTSEGYYEKVPLITANLDLLYYQDANNPNFFGVIKLVDQSGDQILDIDEILSSSTYTSPNGVVFTNGLKVQFEGETNPSSYSGNEYYVEGVGTQIKLVAVEELITPEGYTQSSTVPYDSVGYDIGGFDDTLNAPTQKDYLTINRASADLNAWSRSNRWFHIDVINATAAYNNTVAVIDNEQRANRPILEFKAGIKLYNSGTQAIAPIDIIDFRETDALSNINGTIGYSVDGYSFAEGTRVIFANDTDATVRNKVYVVNFVEFNDSSDTVIDLQPADINSPGASLNETVVVTSGVTSQGKTYYYNGTNWLLAQEKTSINQAPLFDILDINGNSFGDTESYPGTDFVGSKLFSYAVGTGVEDSVIGQPLKYLTIANVGDIVFENNIYTDTFTWVQNTASVTQNIETGYVRQYSNRTNYAELIGWQTSSNQTVSRQSFSFEYTGDDLILDVEVITNSNDIPVKMFVDGVFLLPSNYTYTTNSEGVTQISFVNAPETGALIEVTVISDTASQVAYYTVPSNLENNPINKTTAELTLGTIRNHYNTICQNVENFSGYINGANNIRDLGNVVPYGRTILQQSSPMTLLGTFLNDSRFDYFNAIDFASAEYEKFKNLILDYIAKNDWDGYTTNEILDQTLKNINLGKNENSPFYWTDMLPSGETYEETVYTVTPISTTTFDTLYSYNFNSANYNGILVYLNDEILLADGHEYTVATDGPRITINTDTVTLNVGDVLKIREYTATYGSYVPASPTSLGLFKAFRPQTYVDNTYLTPTQVILGHDGSLTIAFGDIRDDVLLEFEKRVYNNLKVDDQYNPPINLQDVVPGQFRTTDYTLAEINEILAESFLTWVGTNKLPYQAQTYDANNQFTWNYSRSSNKLDGSLLLGNWRAIYEQLYDTDTPHTRPWEMIGLTERPDWWEDQYGPAPYTSGNLVLWEDLRDGRIADPDNTRIVSEFARPQLLDIIPSDSEGNLRSPFDVIVGEYNSNSFRKSWVFGDGGPVETAWRRSSSYVFALQRLMALTQPAKYFSLFADRDAYNYNTTFEQFLLNNRFRLDPAELTIYGNGVAKNSYINWIVDYNRIVGLDSTTLLEERLENIDVRLAYRMASFSDKGYLKIFTEKSSPNSLNSSLLLPDESYQLLLYKNPAFSELTYSSVMVQKTNNGYTIYGYSTVNPYFEIFPSIPTGKFSNFTVGSDSYRIPENFRDSVVRIPYGYTFTTESSVVDFLVSYGKFLSEQGMSFENIENNLIMNWNQMAQEFVYWAQSSWAVGSMINLNPGADLIKITKPNAVAESLLAPGLDNVLLNQNKKPLGTDDYVVERIENTLTLRSFNNNTFNLINARFTAYEHIIVLDNTSIFNDLIYDPGTGARQSRLLVNGYTTYDWNGTLDAQGFILNQDNVQEWAANRSYSKGEIVLYKNSYWSAAEIIPPSETFDFSVWIKSDYNKITKGLLPNIATKADLIRNYYDTNSANLERDADLLGFGLIGFRPRQYMQNLNLDDISQVNLYKQFLGTKGTLQSAEIFSLANLNKEVAEYEITENWAIQRATYGANASRVYFESRLFEEDLFSNPSTVAVVAPGETSNADQVIQISDIWKQSYFINSSSILPTYTLGQPDRILPSAGYVNYDDVDIKVFDFNDLSEIVNNLEEVNLGSNIWVAKSNKYDWNVYRTNLVPASIAQVSDNLNGTCTITFNGQHGLSAGDKLIVKYFDADVDGAYEIAVVPSIKTVVVDLSLPDSTTNITGTGIGLYLESIRVNQASDISTLSFSNQLVTGSRAWVDNDGTGHWAAYEKTDPFSTSVDLTPGTEDINTVFGSSIAQGLNKQGGLVGSPGYNSLVGGVFTYNKAGPTTYVETGILAPTTTGLIGYGTSLDAGDTEYAVTGAPDSLSNRGYAYVIRRNPENGSYRNTQCLVESATDTGSEFGYSVAISSDERWMYVGAPGDDSVYAYNKVEVQSQSLNFVGDGDTTNFDISSTIIIDDDSSQAGVGSQQIGVLVNNLPKIAGTDWVYSSGEVAFTTAPNIGDEITITRSQSKTYLPATSTTEFSVEDLYTAVDIYSFSAIVNDVIQRPYLDYTFNPSTKVVTFLAGVTGTVVISSSTHWQLVDTLTYAGETGDSSTNPRFGHTIDTTTDGRQVIIGSPNDDPGALDFAGTVQVIDRSVERFQITDATDRTYTVARTPNGPVTVKLNNTFLIRNDGYVNNGEFTVAGSTITIASSVSLAVGDILEIETNTFELMQTMQSANNQTLGKYGSSVAQCGTNCSVYIGMPNDSTNAPESGSVDRWTNQARLYGNITSTVTDPGLTPGSSIRINNYDVLVSTPSTWTSAIAWDSGTFVINDDDIYLSIQAVPVTTSISDTDYWQASSWLDLYVNDINTANIPNVVASNSSDRLLLTLSDASAADQFIKLLVLPGLGEAWTDLGFDPYSFAQTIRPPLEVDYGHFGSSISIDVNADTLVIGAPDSAAAKPATFDNNTTLFDSGSTEYVDILERSGVVYTYDFLLSANSSASNPAKFVFGQQLYDDGQRRLDQFGTSVSFKDGVLLVGSPQDDLGDSVGDYGRVIQYNNPDKESAWQQRYVQTDVVDVQLFNSVFTYNRIAGGITRYLDYIDPLQGKILGSARQNIDYITGIDPAQYNVGTTNNVGQFWGADRVGEIWWNTSTVRFIDYHQDNLAYRSRRWGQLFPGSSVDVYQWIESDVPPANYAGEGTVFNTNSYVIGSVLNPDGLFSSKYYFWVKGINSVATDKSKTLSASAVAQYIENPRSSGIPYIAPIATNTVALYNCRDLLDANDTILHIEFDKIRNNDNVHVEYDLVGDGKADSFLGEGLYRKLLDSFAGADTLGNSVPDVNLSPADKYGVQFRPRQSLFEDRFLALENYLTRANTILSLYPIAESKRFDLLNSEEPEPTSASGEWDKRLATYAELTYQNLALVSTGYRYLIASDETQNGLWTIYTVQNDKSLLLTRVQNYDTKQYWDYVDWVLPGYNNSIRPVAEVVTFNDLQTLTNINEGDSAKVTANSFGKFEIYQYLGGEWTRVVAENSTVEISSLVWNYSSGRFGFDLEVFDSQRWDQNPITETRQILRALNEEIFTSEMLIYRNELLILVFEYILTEQVAPEWLIKTSLIDVSHKIRDLEPFQIYRRDNQDFVQEYINEVKPYHVKIKEFNLRYEGQDSFLGTLTDFDVPAYYDSTYNKFISPVLDETDYNTVTTALESHTPSTDPIWQTLPWSQWYDNYKLSLASITVINSGSNYTVPPQVTIQGEATVPATAVARINTAGEVIAIDVLTSGEGYLTTPTVTISGGNGSGVIAVPVMTNTMIRSFDTTIKFDRCEYTSSVQDWEPNTKYEEGSLVRYLDKVYSVNDVPDSAELLSGDIFDPNLYTEVDQSTLSGADRTIGLYDPDSQDPGRELALLIAGIDYPGVQVQGVPFNQNTGYDIGNFDITPFDNLDFGPEGSPTYSPDILDSIYESSFTDSLLGLRSTDINVEGGGFIDTYSSHAPEELVPGSSFDTLDLKVYTRPGADWTGDGHGFAVRAKNFEYTASGITVEFGDLILYPASLSVENETIGQTLDAVNNFTVDWPNKRLTVNSGASIGDVLGIRVFGIGGGNQLFVNDYTGDLVGNSLTVPVAYNEIYEFLIKVNGLIVTDYTYAANGDYNTTITFDNTYNSSDLVTVAVMGITTPQTSWSTPIGQYNVYVSGTPEFDLTVPLQGTNPINMLVLRNGFRLRPPESREHTGDGSSAGPYYLPNRGATNQGFVADNEIRVYVDDELQTLAVDYSVSEWDGSSDRYIEFTTAPAAGANIIVAVTTSADYTIHDSTITLKTTPPPGTVITCATYGDTSEQDLLTQVFQGPTSEDLTESEGFDIIGFDAGDTTGAPGSFSYEIGEVVFTNNLDIGKEITASERLEVHKNGRRLLSGIDFTVSGTVVTLGGSVLGPSDVVVITSYTQQVVPVPLNFRIFQDMLGNQKISRINNNNTTELMQSLSITDDVIHVRDVSKLSQPNPEANIFGSVIIDGERILYRTRNTNNNTLSGLRRGVLGTGIAEHLAGATITNTSIGEILPGSYQKTVYSNTLIGDGTTRLFGATNVTIGAGIDSTEIEEAVRVKVGGTELADSAYTVTQVDPFVEVTLIDAPATGVEVEISIVKSTVMYAQGTSSASNGVALQEQTTQAARFIRGEI